LGNRSLFHFQDYCFKQKALNNTLDLPIIKIEDEFITEGSTLLKDLENLFALKAKSSWDIKRLKLAILGLFPCVNKQGL
jgi:hypothetical protein